MVYLSGSGKRALLDVISRRASGIVRGDIFLNSVSVTSKIFRESCGFVTRTADLIPGLTVRQTLMYSAQLGIGNKVSNTMKRARVRKLLSNECLNPEMQQLKC